MLPPNATEHETLDTASTDSSRVARRRIGQVRDRLASEGWAALLVLDHTDIAWLTGMRTSNAVLVITPTDAHLATDFRYVAEAQALGVLSVHQLDQALYTGLGHELGSWSRGGLVAYSPSGLSHRAFLQLTEGLDDTVRLRAADGVIASLREVKDSTEIAAITRAAELLDRAYELVQKDGLVGRREGEVAWSIERFLRDNGAEGASFDFIVASGERGAFPHHSPRDAVIPPDTLVTIDIGCIVDGYCSDCTRTFATGPNLPDDLRRAYDVTLEAQRASLAAVRPGVTGQEVDAVARGIIEAAGFGDRFGHGLGHGVGMAVHEGPRLARGASTVLQPGMVVTVEPGIYLPGIGGVRIEDLVVVTDSGCTSLTHFTTELLTLEGHHG